MRIPATDDEEERSLRRLKAARENGRCGGEARAERHDSATVKVSATSNETKYVFMAEKLTTVFVDCDLQKC